MQAGRFVNTRDDTVKARANMGDVQIGNLAFLSFNLSYSPPSH